MVKFFTILFFGLTIFSCQMTERFYLHENGSVSYKHEINFSEVMGYFYDDQTKDSLRKIGEFPLDTLMSFGELQTFNQFSNDTLTEAEKEFINVLDKVKVRMKMDDEEGKLFVGIEEDNVDDFNNYLVKMNEAMKKLEQDDPKSASELGMTGIFKTLEVKYDGKNFERIAANNTAKDMMQTDDSLVNSMMQMMEMFQYKLEYHFPKKIKNSSLKEATYSLDGKIMTLNVPISEIIQNPEKYNFKIEFE